MQILQIEPSSLRAGMNWSWSRSFSDFPAPTWTLRYWLKNATAHIELTATASGSDFLVSVPAATTAVYPDGLFSWTATVDNGTDKFQVAAGTITVLPRIDTEGLLDQRSTARKILDDLMVLYQTRAGSGGGGIQHYQIGDRQITYATGTDLLKDIEYWRAQVAAEDAAAMIAQGLGNPRRLYIRFGSATGVPSNWPWRGQ